MDTIHSVRGHIVGLLHVEEHSVELWDTRHELIKNIDDIIGSCTVQLESKAQPPDTGLQLWFRYR